MIEEDTLYRGVQVYLAYSARMIDNNQVVDDLDQGSLDRAMRDARAPRRGKGR
jgi:hypothetical protein